MLWSDDVLDKNDRAIKRLWLAGMLAPQMLAEDHLAWDDVPFEAVQMADKILAELGKKP